MRRMLGICPWGLFDELLFSRFEPGGRPYVAKGSKFLYRQPCRSRKLRLFRSLESSQESAIGIEYH